MNYDHLKIVNSRYNVTELIAKKSKSLTQKSASFFGKYLEFQRFLEVLMRGSSVKKCILKVGTLTEREESERKDTLSRSIFS